MYIANESATKLNNIVSLLKGILPTNAKKHVIFCEVEDTSYEIFYYSYFADGTRKQCYELADDGKISSEKLGTGFGKLANYIRSCEEFKPDSRNVVTITIDGSTKNVSLKVYSKSIGLYSIKKNWKSSHL
jgi:hypothetical protein